ncbi:serine hydrolase [Caulobacter segnis]|uniref:serine hydrolase domain-containing protein n=1 Tax=Caulobacter segnis TaxID=88688 RepID=UPI00240F9464|nr:serine hydrolase domain-containing protein [Caulobacter segnis]MDG2522767.1 serine hydrolase [Caulobacter segnis]
MNQYEVEQVSVRMNAKVFLAAALGALSLAPVSQAQVEPSATPRPAAPATPRPATPVTPAPATAAPAAPAAQPLTPLQLEAYVDGVVGRSMADDHLAGVTVSVVQGGQVVLKKGYGVSSLDPVKPVDPDKTLFRIGSISKTFTWVALMKEVEAGRMRLDAPMNLYLPERLHIRDQGFKQQVQLRHVMTHTGGFEDRALGQLFERDANRVRPLELYLQKERVRRVREPGMVPSYSNYAVGLAGEAVSNVTGKPFEQLTEEQIFHPLGMWRTTFREARDQRDGLPLPMPAELAADASQGFHWAGGGYQSRPYEFIGQIAPAGGASSTAGDMAKYMLVLLNNGSLGADRAPLYSPRTAAAFSGQTWRPAAGAAGWNHGFMDVALPGGRRGYGHGGATLSFFSMMVVVPELNLGVFVSTNTDGGRDLVSALPGMVVQRFYGPAPTLAGPPTLKADASVYEGTYLTTRRAYGGLEGFVSHLSGQTQVSVNARGELIVGGDGDGRAWRATGREGVFQAVNGPETLVFVVENGRAVRYFSASGTSTYERVGLFNRTNTLVLMAAIALIAAIATLVGLFTRDHRELRQTSIQSQASLMQTTQAILWLTAAALFAAWGQSAASDVVKVFYNWPSPLVIIASACALVAAILSVATLLVLPIVWRGGRRVDSWTPWRKLRFSVTTVIFTAFSLLLAFWGALFPWSV